MNVMIQIMSVSKKDYDCIALFLVSQSKFNYDFWKSRFNYWWEENPSFIEGNTARGWVIKDTENIVGFIGNIPTKFQLFNKEISAFNGTIFVVLSEYRTYSLALFLNQVNYSPVVFMTTPSDHTLPLFNTFKIPRLPRGNNSKYHKKSIVVLNLTNLLKQHISHKFRGNCAYKYTLVFLEKLGSMPVLGSIALILPNIFIKIYQSIRLRRIHTKTDFTVKQILYADSSFDELWIKTRNYYANTNIRTANMINWYIHNVNHKMLLFGCYDKNTLAGYAIFRIDNNLKKMECVDLWVGPAINDTVKTLIQYSVEYAQKGGLNLVIFPHFNATLGKLLDLFGLISMQFDERKDFFRLNTGGVIDESNSYFVGLQGDHELW